MIRRPPRSTLDRSSAASDVYKRQALQDAPDAATLDAYPASRAHVRQQGSSAAVGAKPVSYTHLRAHETVLDIVCRLLLEKKKLITSDDTSNAHDVTYKHTTT